MFDKTALPMGLIGKINLVLDFVAVAAAFDLQPYICLLQCDRCFGKLNLNFY